MEWICQLLGGILVIYIIVCIMNAITTPTKCGMCGIKLGKAIYRAEVNGVRYTTCAKCGRRLAEQASKQAVDRVLGK